MRVDSQLPPACRTHVRRGWSVGRRGTGGTLVLRALPRSSRIAGSRLGAAEGRRSPHCPRTRPPSQCCSRTAPGCHPLVCYITHFVRNEPKTRCIMKTYLLQTITSCDSVTQLSVHNKISPFVEQKTTHLKSAVVLTNIRPHLAWPSARNIWSVSLSSLKDVLKWDQPFQYLIYVIRYSRHFKRNNHLLQTCIYIGVPLCLFCIYVSPAVLRRRKALTLHIIVPQFKPMISSMHGECEKVSA